MITGVASSRCLKVLALGYTIVTKATFVKG
jgi:hypothetical protein